MSTYAEIFDRAYNRSNRTRPSNLNEDVELLEVAYRALRKGFSVAAHTPPHSFFGTQSGAVAYAAPGWARPADAEVVFRIEDQTGQEVVSVDINDRLQQLGMPAVYEMAQVYRTVGGADDPAITDTLNFFYGRLPVAPAVIMDNVDAEWPEHFDPLLEIPVAIYVAIKDSAELRAGEIAALKEELNEWSQLFMIHISRGTTT